MNFTGLQEGLLLREEQLAKFRALRQSILDKLSHLSVAQSCVSDLMKDILGRDPPPEAPLGVEANLDLLNTGEHGKHVWLAIPHLQIWQKGLFPSAVSGSGRSCLRRSYNDLCYRILGEGASKRKRADTYHVATSDLKARL